MQRHLGTDAASAALAAAVCDLHPLGFVVLFAVLRSSRRTATGTLVARIRRTFTELVASGVLVSVVAGDTGRWAFGAALFGALAIAAATLGRVVAAKRNHGLGAGTPTVVVGNADDVVTVVRRLAAHPDLGFRPVATAGPEFEAPTVLPHGSLDSTLDVVAASRATNVVFATDVHAGAVPELFAPDRPSGISVRVIPAFAPLISTSVLVDDFRGIPMLRLPDRPTELSMARRVKRVTDGAVAAAGLVLGLIPLLIAMLALRVERREAVLVADDRVRRGGEVFRLWRLRTSPANGFDPVSAGRASRVVRALGIDELPKLFNVLRGDLSLVGSRPIRPGEVAEGDVDEWQLNVTPGIIGPWQIAGESWEPSEESRRLDAGYIENWSLLGDVAYLFAGVSTVLFGRRRRPIEPDHYIGVDRKRYTSLVQDDDLRKRGPAACSILIVTHESAADIGECLQSIRDTEVPFSTEVIVVDNASTDGTVDIVKQFPEVRLIEKRVRSGYSTNSNIAIAAAAGEHLFLMNPDARLANGVLDALMAQLDASPNTGAVAPRLVHADGSYQANARSFPSPWTTIVRRTPLRKVFRTAANGHLVDDNFEAPTRSVDWVLGAAILIRASAVAQLRGFDDGYRLYCEDIDLCWRLQEQGWLVEQVQGATMVHELGEATSKRFFTRLTLWHLRSVIRFGRLHGFGRPEQVSAPTPFRRPVSADRVLAGAA